LEEIKKAVLALKAKALKEAGPGNIPADITKACSFECAELLN